MDNVYIDPIDCNQQKSDDCVNTTNKLISTITELIKEVNSLKTRVKAVEGLLPTPKIKERRKTNEKNITNDISTDDMPI